MTLNPEGIIPIAGGIYGWLLATGRVGGSKDPARNEIWRRKYGTMMKILSPVVFVFGIALLFGLL